MADLPPLPTPTWREQLAWYLDSLPPGARKLVEWQIEAAEELAKAHHVLDSENVLRDNPETGNEFTLAARIACLASRNE